MSNNQATQTHAPGKPWIRRLLYAALILFYFLHHDWWLWDDARLVIGLPAGMFYHVVYCLAGAGLMGAFVVWAWPFDRGGDEP